MAVGFQFAARIPFEPGAADEVLRTVPAGAGVFALRGEHAADRPYLSRAADMRRRVRRLLLPAEALDADGKPILSKRLNLRDRIRAIEWTPTGSEFESVLLLYRATHAQFGEEEARKRLRLHCPYFLRVTMVHEHPRVFVSNKLSRRSLSESFGPFASRAAAERVAEAIGDQFKIRRCHEDLDVHPEHPGCAYGEMGRCLEPCKGAVSGGQYRSEAERVFAYLRTRGASLMEEIAARRNDASEAMDFERAAALHSQWEKAKAVANGADPLVKAVNEVEAVVIQRAAPGADADPQDAAIFLLQNGRLLGPERLSTRGVRAVREQTAVGSSLFAQPLMLSAVPESGRDSQASAEVPPGAVASVSPEERTRALLQHMAEDAASLGNPEPNARGDALALFKRWYYRPEKQRLGEVLLPNEDGSWPVRRILNAAARTVLGPPQAAIPVQREAAADAATQKAAATRVLHPGREGVERTVPVLPKRKRRGESASEAS